MIGAASVRRLPPTRQGRRARGLVCHELVHTAGIGSSGLPLSFQWRGQRYRIAAVDGPMGRSGSSATARVITVRTTSGMRCELEHRPETNLWMINRVLPAA